MHAYCTVPVLQNAYSMIPLIKKSLLYSYLHTYLHQFLLKHICYKNVPTCANTYIRQSKLSYFKRNNWKRDDIRKNL